MAWYWILFIVLGIFFLVLCVGYFLCGVISSIIQAIEDKEEMQKDIKQLKFKVSCLQGSYEVLQSDFKKVKKAKK